MTSIEIFGVREDLEKMSSQINESFKKEGVPGKISLRETYFDSVDAGISTVLQVSFSGIIAIVQVINLVLKLQESRQNSISDSGGETAVAITIEAGNGKKLELKIPENITEEKINNYLDIVKRFTNQLSESQSQKLLKTVRNGEFNLDISSVNTLFESLFIKTQRIREEHSTVIENEDGSINITVSMVEVSLILLLKKEGNRFSFYLPIENIEACQDTFFTFENESILDFQKISHGIKMIDMQNAFVKYEVEKLMLFGEIIQNQEFRFYTAFNVSG